MIDNKLAIAGELTWQEVVESIDGFYEGQADVHPPERGQAKKAALG